MTELQRQSEKEKKDAIRAVEKRESGRIINKLGGPNQTDADRVLSMEEPVKTSAHQIIE